MVNLRELGLDELLRERLAAGTPVLGICLGMQLGFERSTEQGGTPGLGVIAGEVRELEHGSLKLPHIGWNEVSLVAGSPLTEGLPERCAFYHVHSFAPVPSAAEDILGTSVYGAPFASVVAHEQLLRRAVSPREVLGGRLAAAGELRAHLRARLGAGRLVRDAARSVPPACAQALPVRGSMPQACARGRRAAATTSLRPHMACS